MLGGGAAGGLGARLAARGARGSRGELREESGEGARPGWGLHSRSPGRGWMWRGCKGKGFNEGAAVTSGMDLFSRVVDQRGSDGEGL